MNFGMHFSEEFDVSVRVHQGTALSPLLFATVIDFTTNEQIVGTLQVIL